VRHERELEDFGHQERHNEAPVCVDCDVPGFLSGRFRDRMAHRRILRECSIAYASRRLHTIPPL
jgi:hypothetical protein